MKKNKLLTTNQLAELVCLTPRSIHTLRWRIKRGIISPDALPQPINRPGQLRWRMETYEEWAAGSEQTPPLSRNVST